MPSRNFQNQFDGRSDSQNGDEASYQIAAVYAARAAPMSLRSVTRTLLTMAAPAVATTSSCDPEPPEHPIAPMIFPFSTSGIPPADATTPSSVRNTLINDDCVAFGKHSVGRRCVTDARAFFSEIAIPARIAHPYVGRKTKFPPSDRRRRYLKANHASSPPRPQQQ